MNAENTGQRESSNSVTSLHPRSFPQCAAPFPLLRPHLTQLSPPHLCSDHAGLPEILDCIILGHWHDLLSHLDAILSDVPRGWLLLVLQPSRKMALGTPA